MNTSFRKKSKPIFNLYRSLIFDLLERLCGERKDWNLIRSSMLKLLSDQHGLEAKINELADGGYDV